jgi:hypothetical protein
MLFWILGVQLPSQGDSLAEGVRSLLEAPTMDQTLSPTMQIGGELVAVPLGIPLMELTDNCHSAISKAHSLERIAAEQ